MVAVRHTMASEPCLAHIAKIQQFRNYTNSRAVYRPKDSYKKRNGIEKEQPYYGQKSKISRRDILYHS